MGIKKFRKIMPAIEAICWLDVNRGIIEDFVGGNLCVLKKGKNEEFPSLLIDMPEQLVQVMGYGDWICKDSEGVYFIVNRNSFAEMYKEIENGKE